MSLDFTYCYLHTSDEKYVLFKENWQKDDIPYDDLDLPASLMNISSGAKDNLLQQFLSGAEDNENDLAIINGSNPMFNISYTSRSKQKARNLNWKDLGLSEFLNEKVRVPDTGILRRPKFGDPGIVLNSYTDESSNDDKDELESGAQVQISPYQGDTTFQGKVNDSSSFPVNRIQPNGSFTTPVVTNRTISQNLETMNTFSSQQPKKQYRNQEALKVSSASSRAFSDGYEQDDTQQTRIIR